MSEQFTVRFPHIDAAGIMFFPRYFEMLARKFDDSPLDQAPLAMRTRFIRPCRLGDRISVEFNHDTDGWSYLGRNGEEPCFRVASMPFAAPHRRRTRFVIEPERLGRWACGPDGRLHTSRGFEHIQVAKERFLESMIGIRYNEMHMQRGIGLPTVQLTTRISELPSFGDNVSSSVQMVAVGSKSFTLRHQLLRDDECLVENEQVLVFVAMQRDRFQSVAVPSEIREALEGLVDVAA